jgi:hypothetical protein
MVRSFKKSAVRAVAVLFGLASVGLGFGFAGAAWAVSAGGYSPNQQDCPANSDASNAGAGQTTHGCHNVAVNLESGDGSTRYAEFGLDQLPNGYSGTPTPISLGYPGQPNSIHSGCLALNTNGTGGGTGTGCGSGSGAGATILFDGQNPGNNSVTPQTGAPDAQGLTALLTGGVRLYFGQDDNTDAGEHDGVTGGNGTAGSFNGPSDGGGIGLFFLPALATQTPTASDPVPFAGVYEGFCADGICQEGTTQQQTLYQGCGATGPDGKAMPDDKCGPGSAQSRNVYDYSGKQWDPYACSSGDSHSEAPGPNGCGNYTMDQWRQKEAHNVYAEPGFQFYEDPDPEGSPAGPSQLYPLPAVYAGTCGVTLGGGGFVPPAPASPVTNSAGQVSVAPTGC